MHPSQANLHIFNKNSSLLKSKNFCTICFLQSLFLREPDYYTGKTSSRRARHTQSVQYEF